MSIRFVLPGRTVEASRENAENRFHKVATVHQKQVDGVMRGAPEPTEELDCADDDVLELTFADGTRKWISAAALRDDLQRTDPRSQSERGTRVPSLLVAETAADRGFGALALRALKILKVDPVDVAAGAAVQKVIEKFETKVLPDQGLFRFPSPDRVGEAVKDLDPAAGPYLLFLHGTGSSSRGSFHKMANTAEWDQLRDQYQNRILCFEHASLTKSPVQNAIELAKALPNGATLHLVSHSRGGLVGELLSLKPGQDVELLKSVFEGRPNDADDIAALLRVLGTRKFTIERFVRVACPARGTTLASQRLDLYLSALMNVIEFVPVARDSFAVDFIRAVTLETAKRRTDARELPGIEAMMPESPLIRMLNTVAKSDGALAVIAGDAEGTGVLGRLKQLAIDAFFLAKNDYIVNTEAMYGGIPRPPEKDQVAGRPVRPRRVFARGPEVNHFSYFHNAETRAKIAACLISGPVEAGFDRGWAPDFAKKLLGTTDKKAPLVFLLPGIMGSHIQVGDDRIWLDPGSIAIGGMKKMAALGSGGVDWDASKEEGGTLDSFYGLLSDYLNFKAGFRVHEFGYDWRNSLVQAAAKLAKAVRTRLAESDAPIYFLAHSMGGLVVRTMIQHHNDVWKEVRKRNGRLVMLGTPNQGSYAVAVTLAGQNALVGMLGKVDLTKSEAQLREIIRGFPGLIELLTDDLFDLANWPVHPDIIRPEKDLLDAAKVVRDGIKNAVDPGGMVYVAGTGATAHGWNVKDGKVHFQADPYGDGTVTHASGALPGVRTWYVDSAHGNLGNKLSAFDAYADLLRYGTTTKLADTPIRSRGETPATLSVGPTVLFPTTDDLAMAALGALPEPEHPAVGAVSLEVGVAHGDLRYRKLPVAVGHYENDTIVNAEWALDRVLDGGLTKRFRMGIYPGPVGTVDVILRQSKRAVTGAMVIGLGPVGEVTFNKVRDGVARAAMRLALEQTDERPVAFGALLMGTFGGRSSLTIEQSVRAIVSGTLRANRALLAAHNDALKEWEESKRKGAEPKLRQVQRLELIELYEDCANQAAAALDRVVELLPNEEPGAQLMMSPRYVVPLEGGRYLRPSSEYDAGWWRRVQVTRAEHQGVRPLDGEQLLKLFDKARQSGDRAVLERFVVDLLQSNLAPENPRSARLQFLALTDRARAEERNLGVQTALVDALVQNLVGQFDTDNEFAKALFELLLPPDFKPDAGSASLLVVLDRGAARYPWEMLTPTRGDGKPLALDKGLIRQFKTSEGRPKQTGSNNRNALVIGDPKNDLFPLPGAAREAQQVAFTLRANGYTVTEVTKQAEAKDVVKALFARDYRLMHIAAHGQFDAEDPINSGVLLSGGAKITPAEIKSLSTVPDFVFLNCCHLGGIEDKPERRAHFHELAASVSEELIRAGVHAVIAAGWAVNDAAAATFANEFYAKMLSGVAFGDAVLSARQAAHREHGQTNTWGAYQCYGNPDFTLNGTSYGRPGGEPRFYSRSQVVQYLNTMASRIKQTQRPEEIKKELRKIESELPGDWKDGEVLAQIAYRWADLKEREEAEALLDRALACEDGASFKAVEQLANQRVRRGEEEKKPELIDAALARLEPLSGLYPSSERASLVGSAHKRSAMLWAARADRKKMEKALEKATEAYHNAWELAKVNALKNPYYPALNWASCALLSPSATVREKAAGEIRMLAGQLQAETKNIAQETAWERFDPLYAEFLLAMVESAPPEGFQRLAEEYRREIEAASLNERDSATVQFKFLAAVFAVQERSAEMARVAEFQQLLLGGAPVAPAGKKAVSQKAGPVKKKASKTKRK